MTGERSDPSDDISYPNIKSIIIGKINLIEKNNGKTPSTTEWEHQTLGKRKRKDFPKNVPNLCLTICKIALKRNLQLTLGSINYDTSILN